MESAQLKGKRARRGAKDLAPAIDELLRIVRGRHAEAGLAGLDIQIKEDPQEPGVVYCKVKIWGDDAASRTALKKMYTDMKPPWTCTDGKDEKVGKETKKVATCTSPT